MKFIYLFLLLISSCFGPTTVEKSPPGSIGGELNIINPLPSEVIPEGPIGFSTTKAPFFLYIDKIPFWCPESPCFLEPRRGRNPFHILEAISIATPGFLPLEATNFGKSLYFTENAKLNETINRYRPSSLLLPVQYRGKVLLDYFIFPGKAKLEDLTLQISGDLNYKYQAQTIKLPVVDHLPIHLNVRLIHRFEKQTMESYVVSFSKENLIIIPQ